MIPGAGYRSNIQSVSYATYNIPSLAAVNACPIRPHQTVYKIIFIYYAIYKCLLNPLKK